MFAQHQPGPTSAAAAPTPLLEVLGQPDTVRIHVHDYGSMDVPSQSATKHLTRVHRAERALVLARPGDVVVLGTAPDPAFLDYLRCFGVGPDRDGVVVLGDRRGGPSCGGDLADLRDDRALIEWTAARISARLDGPAQPLLTGYCSVHLLESLRAAVSRRLGRPVIAEGATEQAVWLANRKDRVRAAAGRLGIPVAAGVALGEDGGQHPHATLVESVVAATLRQCAATGGAIVRGAWSSSGADVRMIRGEPSAADLAGWLGERTHISAFLVEELLDAVASPNLQVWVDEDGTPRMVGATDQRLGADGSHFGNVHPYRSPLLPAMQQAALTIADYLGARGYRGPLGVDLVEVAGRERFTLAETNGRMNASTYASALFESLNRHRQERGDRPYEAWISRTDAAVRVPDFGTLLARLGDLACCGATDTGAVVPYNTGLLPFGVVDLLMVGENVEHAEEIERLALARLRG